MLSLHYDKLMRKIKKHEEKKYLMVDDYMLDKLLGGIKEIIDIEKFDHKLSGGITLENVAIWMKWVIKDDSKFYPQLFLEETWFLK